MNLKRDFLWLVGSKSSILAASLFTGALINRALGPFGRGIFAEIQTWVDLFIVIFGISIETVMYHFANRAIYGADDKSRFVTVLLLSLVCSMVAVLALIFLAIYWPEQFSPTAINNLILLIALLVTTMLTVNLITFLQSIGNIGFSALIGIAQALLNFAVIMYGYALHIIDVRFVVTRLIIIQAVSLVMLFIIFSKIGVIFGRFSMNMAKGIIKAGFKQHIGTISVFIYTKVNQLIVFKYCGEAQAGIFAVALNLALAVIFIPEVFRTVLYPRVIHSNDESDITIKALRFWFYGWGLCVIAIFLSAKPLLLLYGGNSFLSSVKIFRILMIGMWFLPLTSLVAPYYMKKGAFGLTSFIAMTLGIISIGMNVLLVPRYGSAGAAAATSITSVAGFCLVLLFFYRLSKRNPLEIFSLHSYNRDNKIIL